MQVVSLSEFRKDMKHIMDRMKDRHEPLLITRKNGHVVMMSQEDYGAYSALEETAYILSSPKNAQRVLASLAQLREGKGQPHELIES